MAGYNDIKKSDAYESGLLDGTTPAYDAYMKLKKSLTRVIQKGSRENGTDKNTEKLTTTHKYDINLCVVVIIMEADICTLKSKKVMYSASGGIITSKKITELGLHRSF